MSSPTLKPEVQCWGRGDEISYLLKPVHDEPRSLTLIWGDSGIGKTALLEEFHRTVSGGDYLAGFYQCQRDTGADPLLQCLRKLIDDRVYTIDEWPQVMIEGLQRVKGRLQNPRQVGQLLAGAFGAVEKAPLVGKWAQVISTGLGVAAGLAGPGISLPAEMTQRLAPEVFADVVDVLQAAFPDRPLIFILDNLSADAESQAQIAGVTQATNALLSFVQTHFLARRDLHFVLSWKHIAKTRPSFQELRTTIRQYQGRDRGLGALSNSSVQEWAEEDFDWFRKASAEQQKQAVEIAKGLPEAISQWKERGVHSFDVPRLEEITDDVVKGRYAPLAAELRDEKTTDDQSWLFQLSIMPRILTEHGLGQLWDCPIQKVHSFLCNWCDRALLKKEDDRYLFAHEKKQEVTQKVLAEELVQNGRAPARGLYNFYLSNVGFPNEVHPEAWFYLAFALGLHWAVVTEAERQLLTQSFLLLFDSGPVPRLGAAALAAVGKAPWNTRFFLFHRASLKPRGSGALLSYLEPRLFARKAVSQADRLNLAQGLYNLTTTHGEAGHVEEVVGLQEMKRWLGMLRTLAEEDPGESEIAVWLAKGLFNAMTSYGNAQCLEEAVGLLPHLEALARKHPDEGEIALQFAQGLYNATNYRGEAGHVEEVVGLLERLGTLATEHPEKEAIAFRLAKALTNATKAYGTAGRLKDVDGLLERLEALATERSGEGETALACAKGLNNGIFLHGEAGHFEQVQGLLDRLETLAEKHPEQGEIAVWLAKGLVNATTDYGSAGRLEEVEGLLGRLQALAEKLPEEGEIAVRLAKGLVNATNAYGSAGRLEEVEGLLGLLQALAEKHPEQGEIAVELAKGLVNATNAYGRAGRLEEVEGLLGRLQTLPEKHPEQGEIAVELAKGLVNATNAYGSAGRLEEVEGLLGLLQALAEKHPDIPELAAPRAGGLLLAGLLGVGDRKKDADVLQDLLRRFGETEAFLPVLALQAQLAEPQEPESRQEKEKGDVEGQV